jgi:hypothetical protein
VDPIASPSFSSAATYHEEVLTIAHPASKALQAGQLTERVYAEHVLAFCRNLYERHFRDVLRERGKLTRSAVELVLDTLWEALREKVSCRSADGLDKLRCANQVEDGALRQLELQVAVLALRRRPAA